MALMSMRFSSIINRLLTISIDINYKGHSRAMALHTSLSIWLQWCLRHVGKSWWGTRPVEASVLLPVRQGDALSTTHFNLALHRAIQDIQIQGTTVNRMTQLFASTDDIALMTPSTAALRVLFQALDREGWILGLQINEAETMYLRVPPSQAWRKRESLTTGEL
jgi:hypothetical protein